MKLYELIYKNGNNEFQSFDSDSDCLGWLDTMYKLSNRNKKENPAIHIYCDGIDLLKTKINL